MAEGGIIVDPGNRSLNGSELLEGLPPYFPTDPASNNFRLLDVVGRAVDRLDADIEDVENAAHVQTAETVHQLEELAKLIEIRPHAGESKEKYRTRVLAGYQLATTEGTIGDLLFNVATILNTDITNIGYKDSTERGVAILELPAGHVNALSITSTELVEIIQNQSAAGYRIEANLRGTFTYLSTDDYSGGSTYDPADLASDATIGYDTDANDDDEPDGNGGTYAGLLE